MGKGFTSTILLYLFLFSSCNFLNTTKDSEYLIEKLSLTQFDNNGTAINVIAHRGASFEYPENTLLAFEKAIEHYTDFVELDIFFTKDNIPVVVHDDSLSRTTNGTGFIKDFTFRELSKLDAGSWLNPDFSNETIPSL
ncbi:MAG: glycerophosphodiester phosphodiesterase family protein, partial [Balneolaceae bacterium]